MSSYWYYPNYVVPNQFYESSSSTCSSPSYVEYSNENSPTRSSVYNQCSCCCYVEPTSSPTIVTRPSTQLPNRLQYSVRQRWLLNEIYQHVPYPNSVQKSIIADRIGATREQIRIWFQNRRRIAVQNQRSNSQRSPILSASDLFSVRQQLTSVLNDLELHRNAPQRSKRK